MIIQIIGLPAIGKTTLIKKYLKKNKNVEHVDIRDFTSPNREEKLLEYISRQDKKYIIESACGIQIDSSIVILLNKSKYYHQNQILQRGESYNQEELWRLEDQMIPADYTLCNLNYFDNIMNYYLT